jgi:hypothetical protein
MTRAWRSSPELLALAVAGLGCAAPPKPPGAPAAPGDSAEAPRDPGVDGPPVSVTVERPSAQPPACRAPADRARLGPLQRIDASPPGRALGAIDVDSDPGGAGVVLVDLDGDDVIDVLHARRGELSALRGLGGGAFADATAAWLPADAATTPAKEAAAADLDDDGDPDLVLVGQGGAVTLYENLGDGRLQPREDAGLVWGDPGLRGPVFADLDGDGDLDIQLSGHSDPGWTPASGAPGVPGQLYENLGGLRFADRSGALPAPSQDDHTQHTLVMDLDGDLLPDLYLVNDHGPVATPNRLLLNRSTPGAFAFEDAPEAWGLHVSMLGMGAGVGDLDDDGGIDIVVSDEGPPALLQQEGDGRWVEAALSRGLRPDPASIFGWGTEVLDLDNDGDLDVFMTFGRLSRPDAGTPEPGAQPDALWLMGPDGRFTEQAAAWGADDPGRGRGLSAADLNGDGFLDLATSPLDGPPTLLLSRCDASAWIEVSLAMPAPNVQAIGARVEVVVDGVRRRRWIVAGGTGRAGSNPPIAHFGLGAATRVDRITVIWPDGRGSLVEDLRVNQHVRIRR